MTALLEKSPETTDTGNDNDDLDHLFHCNPDIGLCGSDISGTPMAADDVVIPKDNLCIVCDDLVDHPCPICGEP
jgi:hypothetical protein